MMAKAMLALHKTIWNAKNKINSLKNDESGMETLEVVILIVIAVVIAMLVLELLTGNASGKGLIQQMFDSIATKFGELLNQGRNSSLPSVPAGAPAGAPGP